MRLFSWLLIAVGVLVTGYGAHDWYLSRVGQYEAEESWAAETSPEMPLPSYTPPISPLYFNTYKLGEPVAKLLLPRLSTALYVVEGTDQQDLKKGPGHMPGSALPGGSGNCVIAGHRDTHFRVLEGIRKGDTVELDTRYGTYQYVVKSIQVVSPTNVAALRPTKSPILHLITCFPFHYIGHAPKRMVIEADLVNPPSTLVSSAMPGRARSENQY